MMDVWQLRFDLKSFTTEKSFWDISGIMSFGVGGGGEFGKDGATPKMRTRSGQGVGMDK
jgi:hypothetical protein